MLKSLFQNVHNITVWKNNFFFIYPDSKTKQRIRIEFCEYMPSHDRKALKRFHSCNIATYNLPRNTPSTNISITPPEENITNYPEWIPLLLSFSPYMLSICLSRAARSASLSLNSTQLYSVRPGSCKDTVVGVAKNLLAFWFT